MQNHRLIAIASVGIDCHAIGTILQDLFISLESLDQKIDVAAILRITRSGSLEVQGLSRNQGVRTHFNMVTIGFLSITLYT